MKFFKDLLILNLVTALLILIILFLPTNTLRIAFGLPFVLFFPGYVLTAALFPRKNTLDSLERIALSFGLSLTVVPLIGLVLNYSPWGIKLYSVLISLAIFIIGLSIVAEYRRWRLIEEERFAIPFRLSLDLGKEAKLMDKALSMILIVAILGAIGTLSYVIAIPKIGEKFTEFYLLGQEGKAINYPKELKVGEQGSVTIGIINQEKETINYRVEVRINGTKHNEIGPIFLHHEESWEQRVSFTPTQAGKNQKIEFLLYKQGQSGADRKIHLWVEVKE